MSILSSIIKSPVTAVTGIGRVIGWVFGKTYSTLKSLVSHNQKDINAILEPFAKQRDALTGLVSQYTSTENNLRKQAQVLLDQAEAAAAQGRQAAAAGAKLTDLLGK